MKGKKPEKGQTKLMQFLNNKTHNQRKSERRSERRHSSSREHSDTEIVEPIQISDDQSYRQEDLRTCPQLIMISALDTIQGLNIMEQIKDLLSHYSKTKALQFIFGHAKNHGAKNMNNLDKIEDSKFWKNTLQKLLKFVLNESQCIKSSIQMHPQRVSRLLAVTKKNALMILCHMFLCIMPKQSTCKQTTFAHLFHVIEEQVSYAPFKPVVRLQKLKCLINYFNIMFEKKKIDEKDLIEIQRVHNTSQDFLKSNKKYSSPLMNVQIYGNQQKIQDFYTKHIMVDFANEYIGGGVLGNGAVQEQIMFITFPEAIIAKILCQKMEDEDAVIIYGAQRISNYKGYSETFQFDSKYEAGQDVDVSKSVIVAIDALNFYKQEQKVQYSKRNLRREIVKAYAGFEGTGLRAPDNFSICTGRWGCGAFKGNENLKFLIQWIACSQASKQMIYLAGDEKKKKQFELLVKQLKQLTTLDIIEMIDEYYNFRTKAKAEIDLLDYIKDFVA